MIMKTKLNKRNQKSKITSDTDSYNIIKQINTTAGLVNAYTAVMKFTKFLLHIININQK